MKLPSEPESLSLIETKEQPMNKSVTPEENLIQYIKPSTPSLPTSIPTNVFLLRKRRGITDFLSGTLSLGQQVGILGIYNVVTNLVTTVNEYMNPLSNTNRLKKLEMQARKFKSDYDTMKSISNNIAETFEIANRETGLQYKNIGIERKSNRKSISGR